MSDQSKTRMTSRLRRLKIAILALIIQQWVFVQRYVPASEISSLEIRSADLLRKISLENI